METELRHRPAAAVARVLLGPDEQIRLDESAVLARSTDIGLRSDQRGGDVVGTRRGSGGRSMLTVTIATAPADGAWLDLAGALPGDIEVMSIVPDSGLYVRTGNWLASSSGITTVAKVNGPMMSSGHGVGVGVSGLGEVVIAGFGGLDVLELDADRPIVVGDGHLIAFGADVTLERRRVGPTLSLHRDGPDHVLALTGSGRIVLQGRNPADFVRRRSLLGL